MQRYDRQILLPQIGHAGQSRLAAARVLLVGCGALGGSLAEQLTRAGVGFLRIVDRDVVELSNLQRQALFDEQDVRESLPKAVAAARRLQRINSDVEIEAVVADVHSGNIEELAGLERQGRGVDLILDGTDNVQARYLMNDVAVKHGVAWIYGACVGTEGRMMVIRPPETACLRCVFPEPPAPGELPTCDTAGVLGSAAALVASLQATAAIKLLVGATPSLAEELVSMDLWSSRYRATSLADARRVDCRTCGLRQFEFLEDRSAAATTTLCGRNAVQVRPRVGSTVNLKQLSARLASAGHVEETRYLLKCQLRESAGISLTVFSDARAVISGTSDPARARSIYARYVGS